MACPNWSHLAMVQEDEPQAWEQAVRHLEECEECFETALLADPTLIFQTLPSPRASAEDIASIKDAVATMRRIEPMTAGDGGRPAPSWGTRHWRSLATAASIVLAVLLTGGPWNLDSAFGPATPASIVSHPNAEGADFELTAAQEVASPLDALGLNDGLGMPLMEDMPLVEDVDPSYGSVVQVMDADMSIVLVLPNGDVS